MDTATFKARLNDIEEARRQVNETIVGVEKRLGVAVGEARKELASVDVAEEHVAELLEKLKSDLSQPEAPPKPVKAARGSVLEAVRAFLDGTGPGDVKAPAVAEVLGLKASSVAKALKRIASEKKAEAA